MYVNMCVSWDISEDEKHCETIPGSTFNLYTKQRILLDMYNGKQLIKQLQFAL